MRFHGDCKDEDVFQTVISKTKKPSAVWLTVLAKMYCSWYFLHNSRLFFFRHQRGHGGGKTVFDGDKCLEK